jgi:DNA-binding LacI/PurR family transcriptional regulator
MRYDDDHEKVGVFCKEHFNSMPKRVNSHDVAHLAGVSQSTVSLVLNGRMDARISPQTREKVISAARVLNYSLNTAARALVTGKTRRIAIVLNDPHSFRNRDSYFSDVLSGIMDGAVEMQYNISLISAQYPDWRTLFDEIRGGNSDGVLLIGRMSDDPLTIALLDSLFPTVCINYLPCHSEYYAVDCDNEIGGYLAARHLLELGHRHIAFFHPGEGLSWVEERKQGIWKALQEAGMKENALFCSNAPYHADTQEERLIKIFHSLMSLSSCPTALVFSDEWIAQMLMEDIISKGYTIPGDFSIINFNSTSISERAHPPMTSVWQPLEQIGEAAIRLLIDIFDDGHPKLGALRFPVRLDVRESCGPPAFRSMTTEYSE